MASGPPGSCPVGAAPPGNTGEEPPYPCAQMGRNPRKGILPDLTARFGGRVRIARAGLVTKPAPTLPGNGKLRIQASDKTGKGRPYNWQNAAAGAIIARLRAAVQVIQKWSIKAGREACRDEALPGHTQAPAPRCARPAYFYGFPGPFYRSGPASSAAGAVFSRR